MVRSKALILLLQKVSEMFQAFLTENAYSAQKCVAALRPPSLRLGILIVVYLGYHSRKKSCKKMAPGRHTFQLSEIFPGFTLPQNYPGHG